MTKEEVREDVRRKKRAMEKSEIIALSEQIHNFLYDTAEYQQADAIYTYVSYNQEVMTHNLILKALLDGKKVAVPKVIGNEIEFYYIQSLEELKNGYQHILEPITKKKAEPMSEKKPLMLLPGLAFDKQGHRIGYGGGFYDRYLCKYIETFCTCAMGFSFQLYEKLETEAFDIPARLVITPDGVHRAGCLHKDAERVVEHGVFS